MSLILKYEKKEYPQAPEGLHQAVCVDIVDMPQQQTAYGVKDMVMLWWETEDIDPNTNKRYTRHRQVREDAVPEGSPAAVPRELARSEVHGGRARRVRPREARRRELPAPDRARDRENGNEYANIQAIIAAPKSAAKLSPSTDFVRKKDRQDSAPADDDEVPF